MQIFSSRRLLLFVGFCVYIVRLMGEPGSFFLEILLSDARDLSRRVYASGRDDLSHLRAEKDNTIIFAFSGSLDPLVFGSTVTKFRECQITISVVWSG